MKNSRLKKLENLRSSNIDPYPREFSDRICINKILTEFNVAQNLKEFEKISNNKYKIAGRIESRRDHGSNIFFTIFDQTGSIQLHAKMDLYSDDAYESKINKTEWIWNKIQECDLGDCVGVEGTLSQNKREEPLLLISNWTLLAKALIEPPDKHNGITEPEVKYRHRERDLLSCVDSRALFKTRAEIVFEIRKYLNERRFIEIEAPVLQPIYGGATARPFKTKHNSLGQDFFLSISSELYLKRAMVGGFDRVYSFSRCFRNEGISPEHNPEFTNLEIFETCSTGQDMMSFTYRLLDHLFLKYGMKPVCLRPLSDGRRCCECANCQTNLGNLYDPHVNLPSSDWPLSRKHTSGAIKSLTDRKIELKEQTGIGGSILADKKECADAWELYINDMEIASGASDLNNPFEQEKRLKESEKRAINNIDYDPYDKNYIEALECGALPWAGVGIGIDRLMMLLTGKTNIRDVIMFPTLKQI